MEHLKEALVRASVGERPDRQAISQRMKRLQERRAELRDEHESMSLEELLDRYAPPGVAPSEWPTPWPSTFDAEILTELERERSKRRAEYHDAHHGAKVTSGNVPIPTKCICGGTGFVVGEYAPGYMKDHAPVPCICTMSDFNGTRAQVLYANSGLTEFPTEELRRLTFGNYDRKRNPQNREGFECAVAWARGDISWALLMGVSGVGKTHCGVAAALAVLNRKEPIYYVNAARFADLARKSFDDEQARTEIDFARHVRYMVLDDLGREHATDYSIATVHQLLDARTVKRLPTLLITNLTTDELLSFYGGDASRSAGWHPLISRMKQGRVEVFKGTDQRAGAVA